MSADLPSEESDTQVQMLLKIRLTALDEANSEASAAAAIAAKANKKPLFVQKPVRVARRYFH